MPDRDRYSEAEVRAILKRAAERQHRADLSAEARASGLSTRELKEVAASAGIGAQHVRAAALEVDRGATSASGPSLLERAAGAPTRIHLERTIAGHLDEALWHKLVVELRRTFNTPGTPDQLGAIWEWRSSSNVQDQAEVQVEEVDGILHLTLRRSWVSKARGPIGSAAFITAFSLFLLLIGVLGDKAGKVMPLVGAFMVLGMLAVVGTRVFYPRWTRGQTERYTGLMDRLERTVETHGTSTAAGKAIAGHAAEPVLSLDEIPLDEVAGGEDAVDQEALNPARSRTRT